MTNAHDTGTSKRGTEAEREGKERGRRVRMLLLLEERTRVRFGREGC
jgi:hypothetical protein